MRWVLKPLRWIFVSVGIIVLTTFSIDATDALRGSQSAMSIFARNATESACPEGMSKVDLASGALCIDLYENSIGEACPVAAPSSLMDTKANIDATTCTSVSAPDVSPWTYVSFHQAKTLCAARGARLPTALEWYEAALGTPDNGACNTNGGGAQVGSHSDCVSARGMYDMVGNVWEWIDGEVVDGNFDGKPVPTEGYVMEVDGAGVAIATDRNASDLYNKDYFWSDTAGTYAVMRGGFYGSGSDGGVYAVHAKTAASFASAATGFRCVMNI